MKYLITGSSGFLGSKVVSIMTEAGYSLVVFGRRKPKLPHGAIFFAGDITNSSDVEACRKMHPDIAAVIHMAALVPQNSSEDIAENMELVNVKGTLEVLKVFGSKIESFVYISTAEVYGLPSVRGAIKETYPTNPQSFYGASKLSGEHFSQIYGRTHNFLVSVLRLSVLYGPGDTISRAIPNFIKRAINSEDLEIYGGEELRDYLYVDDAADAICQAAIRRPEGVFNIGTGVGISVRSAAEQVIRLTGSKAKTNIMPRQKKAANLVLDVKSAEVAFGFKAQHIFPDKLEDQIEWHSKN